MKLAIVVGHERDRGGAKGAPPINSSEYVFNCKIADAVYDAARVAGIRATIFYRDGMTVQAVGEMVNVWAETGEMACALELHFNAANGDARGTETLYERGLEQSGLLAQIVQSRVVRALERPVRDDRGAKAISTMDRGHYNLESYLIPAVIVEPAFGDNPDDALLLWQKRDAYVASLVDAAKTYLSRT